MENPLQIVTTSLPNANANQAYSTQMQAFRRHRQFYLVDRERHVAAGNYANGPVQGVLAGTAPGVNGIYPFTVRLLDQVTQEAVTQALSINVVNGVAILTTSLPNAIVNQPYPFQLQGTGQNLIWSIPPVAVAAGIQL